MWIATAVYLLLAASLLAFAGRERLGLVRFRAQDVFLALGTSVGAYALAGAVPGALQLLAAIGSDDGRLATASPLTTAVILLRACVLAPVAEELLFRGVLHRWLRTKLSAPVAIGLGAVPFALIHGFPAVLPLAFLLGAGFGWVRERSGSTVPGILVHAVHNVAMVAAAYVATGWAARLPSWGSP